MRERISFDVAETVPPAEDVLRDQGMPAPSELPERILALLEAAAEQYVRLTEPVGLVAPISKEDFGAVFKGEGLNFRGAPLEEIFPRAADLALFSLTLGAAVSGKISALFADNDPALGYMLDAVASTAADRTVVVLETRFREKCLEDGIRKENAKVLAYSPGYCGWHISAQKKLFGVLRPEDIGITLNESFLMQPLKSVSGVLVAGSGDIHRFSPEFPFCAVCTTHQCRERIASVLRG